MSFFFSLYEVCRDREISVVIKHLYYARPALSRRKRSARPNPVATLRYPITPRKLSAVTLSRQDPSVVAKLYHDIKTPGRDQSLSQHENLGCDRKTSYRDNSLLRHRRTLSRQKMPLSRGLITAASWGSLSLHGDLCRDIVATMHKNPCRNIEISVATIRFY